MQGVNVFENGIGYLQKCLSLYNGGTGYFVLYLAAIMLIMASGDKEDKKIFLPPAILCLVTIYNPIVPVILDRIFDVSSEYYRLFWIAPVIILVPYMAVKLIFNTAPGVKRALMAAALTALMLIAGSFVYADGIRLAQNRYKIPDELMEISGIIHEDSGNEYAKAFFEYEYNMEIRQYDPKMLLTIDREKYLYAVSYTYTQDMLGEGSDPANRILALLVRNIRIPEEDFISALDETGTEYVVLTKGHPQAAFIKKAGLYEIGDTATHVIYRYDLKDPAVYELVDYSDAEHRFSWRMLK